MKHRLFFPMSLLAAMLLFGLASCEVEFSPNAEWKNVPVVYCVLDQDDDTSWVRVERCYLSNDGVFSYGNLSDSINYDSAAISVALLAYEGDILRDSMAFEYMLRLRDSGSFAHGMQPIYGCETRGRLKENYTYFLNIRNADGTLLATTKPVSLIRQISNTVITDPSNVHGFKFSDINNGSDANCKIAWNNLENARIYQPVVRFYYGVDTETRYVDVKCPQVPASPRYSTGSLFYQRALFLDDLKKHLLADTASRKEYLMRVDLYLTCCTEDLNTYMSTTALGNIAIEQNHQVYTNIIGGIGIFAARRTHIYKSIPADDSLIKDRGLYWFLRNLGVGIY